MFSDEIKYQLEFIENSKIFSILGFSDPRNFEASFKQMKYYIEKNKVKNISVVSFNESFIKDYYIDEIVDYMKSTDINFYLSAATSTKLKNFFNPLVNIYFWKDTQIRNTLKWTLVNNSSILFNKSFLDKPKEKNNKGILSIRKQNIKRDYLDSIIDKDNFEGIYRYIKYPNNIYKNF